MSTSDPNELDPNKLALQQFQTGKGAFERGHYRQAVNVLEQASDTTASGSLLHGEIQLWLVTAYEAAEMRTEAIALCKQLTHHPDYKTRQQAKRLVYILEAPRLRTRPEWLTQIPDLATLDESERDEQTAYSKVMARAPRAPRPKPPADLEPIDLSQVNTRDNRFVWVAIGAIALTLGGLFWFGQ